MSDVTQILSRIESGDSAAAEQLLPLVYEELRRLARAQMANERAEHTLQATALVHEAYLRLVGDADSQWDGRGHFFAAAAEAMRRILVEHARAKHAIKRGGKLERVELGSFPPIIVSGDDVDESLELDAALERFAREDASKAELVKLVYFAGQ
jgi:RNA polymerase sigma factor (TIGR02999 family)